MLKTESFRAGITVSPARERDEFLRMVGNAGEIYAFEHERQKYLDDGWELISEDGAQIFIQ